MRISIIIPTFNSQTVIRDCIESIPNDRNLEIIVVDDGSTDNTCSIVKEYNAIKLIRNKNNNGVSFARNRGLEAATGDFVMFLDSDDRFSKGFFDKIKLNSIIGDFVIYNTNLNADKSKEELIQNILGVKNPFIGGPTCKLFSLDLIKKHNIKFQERIINGEDILFNLDYLLVSKEVQVVHESIYEYRRSNLSVTKNFNDSIFLSDIEFQQYLYKVLSRYQLSKEEKNFLLKTNIKNATYMLLDRISYINKYDEIKRKVLHLNSSPYSSFIKEKNFITKTFKDLIVTKLISANIYMPIIAAYKIKHLISSKHQSREYFINI